MSLKLKIRDCYSNFLNIIPISKFEKYRIKKESDFHNRKSILKFLRYRKIDRSIESFDIPFLNLKIYNDGSFISRQLYWYGPYGHEFNEAKLWAYLCSKSKNIIEMGANIGYFTMVGAAASDKSNYTSIEANPFTAKSVEQNLNLNKINNVNLIVAAVTSENNVDSIDLHIPIEEGNDVAPTGAYIDGGESISRGSVKKIKVKTVIAKEIVHNADLIKLDIEGQEFAVLNSIQEQIVQHKPIILIEVRRGTTSLRQLIKELAEEHQYRILAIGASEFYDIRTEEILDIVLQEKYKTRDVLLVPNDKSDIIDGFSKFNFDIT